MDAQCNSEAPAMQALQKVRKNEAHLGKTACRNVQIVGADAVFPLIYVWNYKRRCGALEVSAVLHVSRCFTRALRIWVLAWSWLVCGPCTTCCGHTVRRSGERTHRSILCKQMVLYVDIPRCCPEVRPAYNRSAKSYGLPFWLMRSNNAIKSLAGVEEDMAL